ncbi:MAG: hypothetical protein E6929_11990 [Clostridium sp.]|nr:hypothetical protein [Clostridium sp.]
MKILKEDERIKLIEKYENDYLRFKDVDGSNTYYDLKISNEESNLILDGKVTLEDILNKYSREGKCNLNQLEVKAVDEYLAYVLKYEVEEIDFARNKLLNHPDIFKSFYNYVLNEEFPEDSLSVEGYTARQLYESTYLEPIGAYNYLIYLRNNPKRAIMNLKKGLPRK